MNIFEKINKSVLYVSVIANAVLLMILFGIIPVLLYTSVILNFIFLWFVIKNLQKNIELENNTEIIFEKIDLFRNHLEQLYELEMYYGDDTLMGLIEHSRQLLNDFVDFQQDYTEEEELDSEPEENEEEEISS
mgnify:CR=1 FL=1